MAESKINSARDERFNDIERVFERADREQTRYWVRKRSPRGRNIGSKPPQIDRVRFHAFLVTTTVWLPLGTVINGCRVPDGSRMEGVSLAAPLRTRGQAKKALARARRAYPNATLTECWGRNPIAGRVAPSLIPPEGSPPGWWSGLQDGDANASVPVPLIEIPWGNGRRGAANDNSSRPAQSTESGAA